MKELNTNHRGGWQPWEELMRRWVMNDSPVINHVILWVVNEEILGDSL